MARHIAAIVCGAALALANAPVARAQDVVVAVTAKAGAVEGKTENSDAFTWRLLTEIAAPALPERPSPLVFETWASDDDTFTATPHWPGPEEPKQLHRSVLESENNHHRDPIDVPCAPPGNAGIGGFPESGQPAPCIAEETKRNGPMFDYIVGNNLNTKAGLAAAFAKPFQVEMPPSSISIKGDWVPVQILRQWTPGLDGRNDISQLYYTTTVASVEYALVGLHISSRQNPTWVWGTFEHQSNPGRCDFIGCFDSFGAETPVVLPNKTAVNAQYGSCPKTPALKAMMTQANLSPVWQNYCLKSTQVDFVAPDGTPTVLGNSVIEGIVGNGTISASSCITCHAYASFGATGAPTIGATSMIPFNPTGKLIAGVLAGSKQFGFQWGVLRAP